MEIERQTHERNARGDDAKCTGARYLLLRIEFRRRERRKPLASEERRSAGPVSRLCDGRGKSFNQYLND